MVTTRLSISVVRWIAESREWLKTKRSETGVFAITGFSELGEGKLDAVYVAEARDGVLWPAGQVRFFERCSMSDVRGRVKNGIVPVWLGLVADIKFFGRHKGGSIRDGVILSVQLAKPARRSLLAGTGQYSRAFVS